MYLRTLLLFGILSTFHGKSECSPPNSGLPAAIPKKFSQGSNHGCSGDTECPDGHYCGVGRGTRKQCRECFDCPKVKRSSKIAYDGKACAHNQLECGECNPGYIEAGGVCHPDERIPQVIPHPVGGFDSLLRIDEEKIAEGEKIAGINPVTIAATSVGVLILVLIMVGFGVNRGVCKVNTISSALSTKIGGTRQCNEEEALRLSNDNCSFNEPSAPPDEYRQQPAYLPNSMRNASYNMPCDRLITERGQGALPFDRGNGGGAWAVTDDDAVQVPDETDSNPNIPPQPQSSSSGANNGNANGRGRLHRQAARRSLSPQRNVGVHQPRDIPPADGLGRIPGNNLHQPYNQNGANEAVVGRIRFEFHAGFEFANYSWQNQPRAPQNPPGMAVSAPASPSSIRMDESSLALENMALHFNDSRDSGTGTDDENFRVVPSHSVSDSDMEDSMFDDANNT